MYRLCFKVNRSRGFPAQTPENAVSSRPMPSKSMYEKNNIQLHDFLKHVDSKTLQIQASNEEQKILSKALKFYTTLKKIKNNLYENDEASGGPITEDVETELEKQTKIKQSSYPGSLAWLEAIMKKHKLQSNYYT